MKKIRKAVIPAAGYGTGFLPATKAFAKEMLPIVDKPIIQFIVEEAIASGIEEILIIGSYPRLGGCGCRSSVRWILPFPPINPLLFGWDLWVFGGAEWIFRPFWEQTWPFLPRFFTR